ncbi:MAG: hypothetical protein MJ104_08520 [Lachnospiraceae bacterium]|nr:hypothetical protein [Lachnospiraceae bacterium]
MWTITSIEEADYGCEERMPGEMLMVLVTLEDDFGREISFECADSWLLAQELDEGDEWPEDIEELGMLNEDSIKANEMSAWMDNYYRAVEEMEEEL